MSSEMILVLDFGGHHNQLIARKIRELKVYCEVLPYNASIDRIKSLNPKGIILTGGPSSIYDKNAPACDVKIFELGVPILGICYGVQLMSSLLGGEVSNIKTREYRKSDISVNCNSLLFDGLDKSIVCWMDHTDCIITPPNGFEITAVSPSCPTIAIENTDKKLYGIQFHPETIHTYKGKKILENFLFKICGLKGEWDRSTFVSQKVLEIKEKVKDKKILCALSGGVDSSVSAVLVNKAVGKQLTCIFVDHGLLRKNEADEVEKVFRDKFNINLIRVNAQDRFLNKLKGITDPEQKRKIIGEEFIRVFEEEAKKLGTIDFLVQGTIYSDVIESGMGGSSVIKSHHNVGGLPQNIDFKEIIEPLRNLFKDEVRKVGEELGISHELVYRQPFPGPGLAIRIIGDITQEKLDILRDADAIFREEIKNANLDQEIWQYFAVLTGMRSVGVSKGERTYDYTLALRAITSIDGMTADWARIPYEVLEAVSNRIVSEVKYINRIVYDITSKPPATIEWE